jgi:hypothetical protein
MLLGSTSEMYRMLSINLDDFAGIDASGPAAPGTDSSSVVRAPVSAAARLHAMSIPSAFDAL